MTNQINSYEALLERVWADEDFKNGFIADPKPILAKIGAKVPDSVKVEVHEDGPDLQSYILPRKEHLERYNLEGQNPIISQVIQQALADEAFKARLLQNPKAGIKEATGEDVPDALTICFHEDTPTVKHLVIPANPTNEELSDCQLEMVAGGIAAPILTQPPFIAGMLPVDSF